MKKRSDKKLGMQRAITRRDFVQGVAVTAGAALQAGALGSSGVATASTSVSAAAQGATAADYPPIKTGMRGSHPGAYEIAHALARDGTKFPDPELTGEHFDLIVVGAGISGLAAAHYYQQRFGPNSRILLLENHDDFGGHAKRNEFHQSGEMVLSLGGTHNLEWWKFSEAVNMLLSDLGIDTQAMRREMTFEYGRDAPNSPAMWFDTDTYGESRLISNFSLRNHLTREQIDQIPISVEGRKSLLRLYSGDISHSKLSEAELETLLSEISYPDFLREYAASPRTRSSYLIKTSTDLTVSKCVRCLQLRPFGRATPGRICLARTEVDDFQYPVAMWPDGNASLARLLVAKLIPEVAPEADALNIAAANFDYSQLDQSGNNVRLRLNATVVNTENTETGVSVTYASSGKIHRVTAKHSVLACYHSIIPHLCPSISETQKDALKYQVKMPLVLTNVLIRNREALDKLGIDAVSCPGRLHGRLFLFQGIFT